MSVVRWFDPEKRTPELPHGVSQRSETILIAEAVNYASGGSQNWQWDISLGWLERNNHGKLRWMGANHGQDGCSDEIVSPFRWAYLPIPKYSSKRIA